MTQEDIDKSSETKEEKTKTKGPHVIIPFEHGSDEMTKALEGSSFAMPKEGDLVKGEVVSIGRFGVVMDLGGKLTGLVRGKELDDESGEYSKLKIGDTCEATVVDIENEQGMLELSLRQAGHRKAWDYLQELLDKKETVQAKIIDANKGGLIVKVGNVEGFLPVSQLTVEHYPRVEGGDKNRILERLKSYSGESFSVKVMTVKEQDAKLIVSERMAWEEEQGKVLSKYEIGSEVEGRVTGVVDFGAFVEFGEGLEGLVHISELAWQRIDDPHDIVKVGDNVKAKVIAIENGRVSLSMKQLVGDPWRDVAKKYKVGDEVEGKVLKISPYGAFVELDNDIHGLAHVSELSKSGNSPSEVLKTNETYKFKILSLEPAAHRLGLGLTGGKSEQRTADSEQKTAESK